VTDCCAPLACEPLPDAGAEDLAPLFKAAGVVPLPYEAAAWSIISARRHRAQAAADVRRAAAARLCRAPAGLPGSRPESVPQARGAAR
jgi:hypothetical protein